MKLLNFWLIKSKEEKLLRIVDWAQKNLKKVETLNKRDIEKAMRKRC